MQSKYGFPTSTPESQGLSSRVILGFIDEIEREHIDLQSLIIMRNGHIITEGYWAPFGPDKAHRMFSSRKAVIGAAILLAIQEGLLTLDSRVMDIFPDKVPAQPSANLQKITYYHMLTMSCGHAVDPSPAVMLAPGYDRVADFFNQGFPYAPGTHFLYDNSIPEMLCRTIHKLTGKTVIEYLQPRLFEPLGMKSFRAHTNDLVSTGATICCSTPDLFRLTVLYYQKGRWENKQILDEKLARMACSYLVPSLQDPAPLSEAYNTKFGYGFQIWRNSVGGFRIDGALGQFGMGIPEMDLVACMNASEADQNIIPVLFCKHITNKLYARPLKEDLEAAAALEQKLQSLTWAPVHNKPHESPFSSEYIFSRPMLGCERIQIQYTDQTMRLTTAHENNSFELIIGAPGKWEKGSSPFIFPEMLGSMDVIDKTIPGYDRSEVYSTGHWLSDSQYEILFRSDAWIVGYVITLEFENDKLTATYEDGMTYSMRHRSPSCRPPRLDVRQPLISEKYSAQRC
jgi:CubicO group peptidase (beta-lactamase class C family)